MHIEYNIELLQPVQGMLSLDIRSFLIMGYVFAAKSSWIISLNDVYGSKISTVIFFIGLAMPLNISPVCEKLLSSPSSSLENYIFCLEQDTNDTAVLHAYKKSAWTWTYAKLFSRIEKRFIRNRKTYNLYEIVTRIDLLGAIDLTRNRLYQALSNRVSKYQKKHPKALWCSQYLTNWKDIPKDVHNNILTMLPEESRLAVLSTSKETYSINRLSKQQVSTIVSKYYSKQDAVKGNSSIVDEVLKNREYQLDLFLDIEHINRLPSEMLKRDNLSIFLKISRYSSYQISGLNSEAFLKIKSISISRFVCTSQLIQTFVKVCPNLEELDISNCHNITTLNLVDIEQTQIKKIDASSSNLTSQGLRELFKQCPNLEELDISNCHNITTFNLVDTEQTQIKKINANNSNLTSQGLRELLKKCPNLEELDINDCQNIATPNLLDIEPTQIKKIDAANSNLTSQGLQELLKKCPNLEELNVRNCSNIDSFTFSMSTETQIKKLNVDFSECSSQGVQELLQICPNLEELSIMACVNIQNLVLPVHCGKKIKKIDASYSNLTSQGLQEIIAKCPNLEELALNFCSEVRYLNLSDIQQTQIKKIDASYSNLTSQGVQELIAKCSNLEELVISSCSRVRNLNVSDIQQTQIKKIDASYSNLTSQGLQELLQICPNLQDLDVRDCQKLGNFNLPTKYRTQIKRLVGLAPLVSRQENMFMNFPNQLINRIFG